MANISREERLRRQALQNESGAVPESGTTAAVAEDLSQVPSFTVAERRLKHGDIAMLAQQADVELKGLPEPMALYWGLTEDAYELINLNGWVAVETRHLPTSPEKMGLTASPDGHVTRGKNGSEMLFMMPERLRNQILFDQADRRQRSRLSRRHHLQQAIRSAQDDAGNPNLSPQRRESAARSAAMMESSQKAKFTFTEYTESHSRNTPTE